MRQGNAADDKPATVESLTEGNKHLQAELAQLKSQAKNTSYELARENRALKEQIEKLTDAADGMTQEQMSSGFRPTASDMLHITASSILRDAIIERFVISSMPAQQNAPSR